MQKIGARPWFNFIKKVQRNFWHKDQKDKPLPKLWKYFEDNKQGSFLEFTPKIT